MISNRIHRSSAHFTYVQLFKILCHCQCTKGALGVHVTGSFQGLIEADICRTMEHHGHTGCHLADVRLAQTQFFLGDIALDDPQLGQSLRVILSDVIEDLKSARTSVFLCYKYVNFRDI